MSESNIFVSSIDNLLSTPENPPNLLPKVIYFPQQWSDLANLEETSSEPISAEIIESEVSAIPQSNEQSSLVEATIIETSEEELSEDIDWFSVARKLGQQNRELIKTVVHLEQAVSESQHQLHNQKLRFRSTETLLTQQTQELSKTQAQVTQLNWELEQAQRINQNQQLTLGNITQLLEDTQQQTAQLERECAFLKQDNNEKTQQIIFLEQQIQEFRSRLHRQQRYTLQYKAALDKCLELPQSQIDNPASIAPKATSIQPWSSSWQEENSLRNFDLEINSYESQIENDLFSSTTVSLNPENLADELENNLAYLNNNAEEDDFLDEFFASFEPDEPVSSNLSKKSVSSNWPSPLISSISTLQKSSSKFVDLPSFLRHSAQ